MSSVKFAVVGFGFIGRRHATIIQGYEEAQLVAIIDINDKVRSHELYPAGVAFFTSIHDMYTAGIQPDVVNICTPNYLHASQAVIALENDSNVVIEKPMALTKAEAEQVVEKSLTHSRNVFVVKQNRYSPPSKWLKEVISKGHLGDIFYVQINCFWNRDERYYSQAEWRGKLAQDGGVLFTQFSHFIDILYWVFGDIKNVKTSFQNFNHQHNTEFEDTGVVQFEFVKGGIGSMNFSTSVWNKNMESSMAVIGSKGSIKIGGQYMNEIVHCHVENYTMPDLEPTNPPNDYGPFKGSAANHHYVIENVVDTLNGKSNIHTNAMEGLKVIDMIERIYKTR